MDRQVRDAPRPEKRARLSIQSQLIVLLVLILAPTLLIQAGIYYDRVQSRRSLALQSNLELARALGSRFDGFIRDILNQELAIGIAVTSSQPLPAQDVHRLLVESKSGYPSVRCFSVISPEGRYVASGDPGAIGKDVGDRPYFQEIVAGKDWVVSNVVLSRVFGDPVFVICRAIREESGSLLGVVLAAVMPQGLDTVFPIERKGSGSITLVDREGTAVFRNPAPEWGSTDRSLPKIHPAIKGALAGREVSGIFESNFDGKRKIMAAVPIASVGWVMGTGVSEDEEMSPAFSSIAFHSVLFLAVVLSAFLLALLLSRRITSPVKKLRERALLLGKGKSGDDVEIGGASELQDLASAFEEMARRIRSREDSLLGIKSELERRVEERTADLARSNEALKAEIIERNRAEDTIRSERERLFSLLDNLPAVVYLRAPDYSIRFANRLFRTFYGTSTEGKTCFEVLRGMDRPCEVCPSREVLRTKEPREWEWTHPGSERAFRVYSHPFTDVDGSSLVMELGTDITERKRAEESLQESESRLRELSSRLLSVQEDERKTIAGEIHDSLGSSLTAIKIALESTRSGLESGSPKTDLLDSAVSWTQHALDEARRLMNDLHPSMLEDLGLMQTMNWFLRQYQSLFPQVHVEREFEIDEDEIPEPLKIVIYRIIQEAFNNISKYSKAEYVTLSLRKAEGWLELAIEDNGDGFDPGSVHFAPDRKGGLGLTSMRERARLSGGSLSISSIIGEGTRVCGSWPISP